MTRPARRALVLGVLGTGAIAACTGVPRPGPMSDESPRMTPSGGTSGSGEAMTISTGDERLDAALRAAYAGGAAAVLEQGATYHPTRPLVLDGLNLQGHGATLAVGPDFSGQAVILVRGTVRVDDLTLAAQPGSGAGGILTDRPQAALTLRKVALRDLGGRGIMANQGAALDIAQSSVHGCARGISANKVAAVTLAETTIAACGSHGVVLSQCDGARITTVNATGCGAGGSGDGVVVLYSRGFTLESVVSSANQRNGITLGGGEPGLPPSTDWAVVNCQAINNGGHGLTIDLTIRGKEGLTVASSGRVEGGVFRGNGLNGINNTCSGGVLIEKADSGGNGQHGISVASADVQVQGNNLVGNSGAGLALFGGGGGCNTGDLPNHVIFDNRGSGNGRGGVIVSDRFPHRDAVLADLAHENLLP